MFCVISEPNMLPYRPLMDIYSESIAGATKKDSGAAGILQAEQNFFGYLYYDFFSVKNAVLFTWNENGRPVAAVRMEPYRDGLLVTGLETRPDMRGRGVAKRLLCDALEHVRKNGVKKMYSHIVRENAASIAVHKACGFEVVQTFAQCLDGSTDPGMDTYCKTFL